MSPYSRRNRQFSAIEALVQARFPGARVVEVKPLAADAPVADGTGKAAGYGLPLRVELTDVAGRRRSVVFRTASANDFGHDRRSDRAQGMLLAYDTFGTIPRHVRALDVGAGMADGSLRSLAGAGELYLLTEYAPGQVYADDLRRIARDRVCLPIDVERADALAGYLVGLHRDRRDRPAGYRRAIRDLVGHGEGIFGIVDGYPADTQAAPPRRLQSIEAGCLGWRWRLRGSEARLCRSHGDFHPFNVIFDDGVRFTLLDTSRGSEGDPADDVICMAINYVFFALEERTAWPDGLGVLWRRFWSRYLDGSRDGQLLDCAAPYLAWRGLVLANPCFYPALSEPARDALLGLVERALAAERFEPAWAEELFR